MCNLKAFLSLLEHRWSTKVRSGGRKEHSLKDSEKWLQNLVGGCSWVYSIIFIQQWDPTVYFEQ